MLVWDIFLSAWFWEITRSGRKAQILKIINESIRNQTKIYTLAYISALIFLTLLRVLDVFPFIDMIVLISYCLLGMQKYERFLQFVSRTFLQLVVLVRQMAENLLSNYTLLSNYLNLLLYYRPRNLSYTQALCLLSSFRETGICGYSLSLNSIATIVRNYFN